MAILSFMSPLYGLSNKYTGIKFSTVICTHGAILWCSVDSIFTLAPRPLHGARRALTRIGGPARIGGVFAHTNRSMIRYGDGQMPQMTPGMPTTTGLPGLCAGFRYACTAVGEHLRGDILTTPAQPVAIIWTQRHTMQLMSA